MDDALLMRRFERVRDLFRDRQCLVDGDCSARMRCDRSSPGTSSMTGVDLSACSSPWMIAMLG